MRKLSKNWKNIKEIIEYPKEGILSKQLVKTDKIDITLFCMAKDSRISEHTSTKEGLVFIVEGKGEFNLSGEKIAMSKNIIIFMKRNMVHSIKAEKNTSFILSLFS